MVLQDVLARLELGDCWVYPGGFAGYATVRVGGRTRNAHRYVYEQLMGPVPEGLQLDHLCRVKRCCNPDHMEPVTGRENVIRGVPVHKRRKAKPKEKPMPEPQLLRITEAAQYLNISRTTMYRLINEGTIKTVQVGQRKRVPVAEINRLIAEQMDRTNGE